MKFYYLALFKMASVEWGWFWNVSIHNHFICYTSLWRNFLAWKGDKDTSMYSHILYTASVA